MHTSAGWPNAVSKEHFDLVAIDKANGKDWAYDKFYGKPKSHREHTWQMQIHSMLGYPQKRKAGKDIASDSMEELGKVTVTDVELALGVDLDNVFLENNRHIKSFLRILANAFGISFKAAKCLWAALPFIRAFSSTNQALYDDGALCASRTLANGETYSNTLGANSLTHSLAWDAVDKLNYGQTTEKGIPVSSELKQVILHPSLARTAEKIFNQKYEPDVMTRNENKIAKKGIDVIECRHIPTTYKFFLGESAKDNFIFHITKKLTREEEQYKRNRTSGMFCHMRLRTAAYGYRDVVGSQ